MSVFGGDPIVPRGRAQSLIIFGTDAWLPRIRGGSPGGGFGAMMSILPVLLASFWCFS
jgi:hypothetical protein